MKFYDGEKLEVVLKPTDRQIDDLVRVATSLMHEKMDRWVMDRLTIPQLQNAIKQFQAEIERRNNDL